MNAKIMAMMMVGVMMFSGCVVMMDAGDNDATATNTKMYGAGSNGSGQQGDNSTDNVIDAKRIGAELNKNVIYIACSALTTFFITEDHWLYGMGLNGSYQQGNNSTTNITVPTRIGTFDNVAKVFCSTQQTFIITEDNEVWGWGANLAGEVGVGSNANVPTPTRIGANINETFIDVIPTETSKTFFLTASGKLYATGSSSNGGIGLGLGVSANVPTQVGSNLNKVITKFGTLNSNSFYFMTSDGLLYGFGSTNSNAFGNSNSTMVSPMRIATDITEPIVDFSVGQNYIIVLTDNNEVWGAGANTYYQLGLGNNTNPSVFTQITASLDGTISKIVCGIRSSAFITNNGSVYIMGTPVDGNTVGNSTKTTPTLVNIDDKEITDVVLTYNNSYFLSDDYCLYGVGDGSKGQLGNNSTADTSTPVRIGADYGDVMSVVCGNDTSYVSTLFFLAAPSTHVVTISSNNVDYGTVSNSSITVEDSTPIAVSDNTITIGTSPDAVVITATPTTSDAQYTYAFVGWSGVPVSGTIDEDLTITATFSRTINQYTATITNSTPSYGSVSPVSVTADYGSAISSVSNVLSIGSTDVTATPEAADAQYTYAFGAWGAFPATLTEDIEITVSFTQTVNEYTITWSISGVTSTETYLYGQMPTHADPTPPEGYLFAGWSPSIATVTQDQTYTAVFEEIVYITVTFDPNGGQLEGSATKSVGIGTPYGELPTPKKDNNKFLGWFTDPEEGTQVTADTIVTADADQTLYAHWELTGFAAMLKPLLFLFPLILLAFLAIALVRTFA